MRACRHDDVELAQHLVRDVLGTYESMKEIPTVWKPYRNLIIASLPNCYEHHDAHDFYQNRTHSARVFMYLIAHKSDGFAPFDALSAHHVGNLFKYIASGAIITSNETLLRGLANVYDLAGINPEKYYRPGFSGQISPHIHELACAVGMHMSKYDEMPSILSVAINDLRDLKLFDVLENKEIRLIPQTSRPFSVDRIVARGRYDLLAELYRESRINYVPESFMFNHLLQIDIHSQSFAHIAREVADHMQSIERELDDDDDDEIDILIRWFVSLRDILTIPVQSIHRILTPAQYIAYIKACALNSRYLIKTDECIHADIAYLREFDNIRASLDIDKLLYPFNVCNATSTARKLNAGHDVIDAITELYEWVRAHPDTDAPQSLVHACITASTPCDTGESRLARPIWCFTEPMHNRRRACAKRAYVTTMVTAIREILAWSRFANLSAFDKFALGMLFDDTRVMRESKYQVGSDTFLGVFAIGRAISCRVAITYDMLDSALQTNPRHLQHIIEDMSIGNAFIFLRSMPDTTLLEIMRDKDEDIKVPVPRILADIVFSERS
jgi:hypothetical protein